MSDLFLTSVADPPLPLDWLSPAEREYHATMHSPERRRLFLNSRVLLRHALSLQCQRPFHHWKLDRHGQVGDADRFTSLAHRPDGICCGVAAAPVGVDLEGMRPAVRWRAVARRWFHPAENRWLDELDDAEAEPLFYLAWCLKEAWVKATGRGLAHHFQALTLEREDQGWSVSVDRAEPDWHFAAGWHQGRCVALVARDGLMPRVRELVWEPERPERLLECNELAIDWKIEGAAG